MTTPEQNLNLASFHIEDYKVVFRPTGQVVSQGTATHPFHYRRYQRPQSSSSPVRPDKTRRPTNWETNWRNVREPLGSFTQKDTEFAIIQSTGQVLHDSVPEAVISDSLEALLQNARLAALAQAVEKSTQLNAALAQCRDTVALARRYVTGVSGGLLSAWNRARRQWEPGDLAPATLAEAVRGLTQKHWREYPNEYLAYLYGVAPLGDDLANGLDRLSSYRLKGYSLSMLLKKTLRTRETRVEQWNAYCGQGVNPVTATVDRQLIARAVYRFDVPSWYLDTSPTLSPFSTAWELTRYSFVLDWFLPVGSWLQALESAQFSPFFREGSETVFVKDSMDLATLTSDSLTALRVNGSLDRGRMRRRAISEYPSSVLTRPALRPFPGVNQISQGLALLTQAFQRAR